MLGITPAPPGARFHGTLPNLGAPIHIAEYADGVKICAYPRPADPTIGADAYRLYLPWQWGPELQKYVQRALPDQPRPLYRPENLELHPDWPVYVFEREDMVDAFHALSGDEPVIATTVPGGSGAFEMGEWGELYGRQVTLWPTHQVECEEAMNSLARKLEKARNGSQAAISVICNLKNFPPKWSFLDAVAANWTWPQVVEFVSQNIKQVEAQIVPIAAARARANAAAPVAEPKQTRQQPAVQVTSARDVWSRIPGLDYAPNGTPYSHLANIVTALHNFRGKYADVWYDEFHCRIMTDEQHPRTFADSDAIELCVVLQRELKFAGVRTAIVHEAVDYIAKQRRRHEVRDWLESLVWDEKWRLGLMLFAGWGAEASPYTSAVGRCFLMGAVARILNPGCQVDNVPVFQGKGGTGKTSSLRALFGLRWFDNPTAMLGDKDFLQNMNGKWCLELGELANIKGRALEVVKSTITRVEDTYRAAYGRTPGTYKRQCIFAGTIDRGGWNADRAGGRRWWPVKCGKIDLKWITDNREQLFAEAVALVKEGRSWHDVPDHAAVSEQAAASVTDLWTKPIARYLDTLAAAVVDPHDILKFALEIIDAKDWTPASYERLRGVLTELKWQEQRDGTWTKPAPVVPVS